MILSTTFEDLVLVDKSKSGKANCTNDGLVPDTFILPVGHALDAKSSRELWWKRSSFLVEYKKYDVDQRIRLLGPSCSVRFEHGSDGHIRAFLHLVRGCHGALEFYTPVVVGQGIGCARQGATHGQDAWRLLLYGLSFHGRVGKWRHFPRAPRQLSIAPRSSSPREILASTSKKEGGIPEDKQQEQYAGSIWFAADSVLTGLLANWELKEDTGDLVSASTDLESMVKTIASMTVPGACTFLTRCRAKLQGKPLTPEMIWKVWPHPSTNGAHIL
ncbi:hypothetical protein BASA82_000604 [Batrachochytrium salamandrivorans]|nr:hypothetical protein BASA82_000604 [Batrachochytrium salamandrivorans]